MSDFKQAITNLINKEISNRATNFEGLIADYNHLEKTCCVEISNPTGPGMIRLQNRSIPQAGTGIIPGGVNIGDIAVMVCPQGNYTHAKIVSIKPKEDVYNSSEKKKQDMLPRGGKELGISSGIR